MTLEDRVSIVTGIIRLHFLMRGYGTNTHFIYFRMILKPHQTGDDISCSMNNTYPAPASSHCHYRPLRAASVRAARGRCFDAKREATAPGCRACSASREHLVGSLAGQDKTEAHSNNSTSIPVYELPARPRRQFLTMAHIHHIVPPRCRTESSLLRAELRVGRVWTCTRLLQSLCSS